MLATGTVLLLGACDSGTPTTPTTVGAFANSVGTCSPSEFVKAAADVAGRPSTLVDLASLVTNQNAGTPTATSAIMDVYAELARLADAGHGADTWTEQNSADGANLTVLGLACGTFSLTGASTADAFKSALDASGLYEVRGGGSDAPSPAVAHDGLGGVAAPAAGFGSWLSGRGLFYGYPISTFSVEAFGGYAMDISLARPVIPPATAPAALIDAGVVALCAVDNSGNYEADQLRISKTSHILPVADGFLSCPTEPPPANITRTTAAGVSIAFGTLGGGVGGTIRNFSPHEVVFPGSVNLSFVAQPANGASGQPLVGSDGQPLAVKVEAAAGTPWEGVGVQLAALKNEGSFVAVCHDIATTDENGIARFPDAILNKAGGYTIVARTLPSSADQDVLTFAPDSVSSGLFNMKNGNAPTSCQ